MDFDNVLRSIGQFGRYQRKMYLLLNLMSLFQCCQMLLLVFVADKPQWRCSTGEQSLLDQEKNSQGYPCYKNASMCQNMMFDGEFTSVLTEWNLVCDQEYKANIAQSVTMAGCLIGVLISGRMSDRFGRKYVIIISQTLAYLFGLFTGLVQTYNQFLLVRFLCGMALVGGNLTSFVLMSETIGPSYRGRPSTQRISNFFCCWLCSSVFRDWRHLSIAVSMPALLYMFITSNKIQESPRWLISQGRTREAKELLEIIAQKNKAQSFNLHSLEMPNKTSSENSTTSYGFCTLFTHKSIRLKMVILTLVWLVNSLVYYGLSFNIKNIEGDRYWNFSLSGLVEIPSYLVAIPLIDKLGRRMSLFCTVMVAALGCILCGFGPSTFVTPSLMLGKFGISSSFGILYVYSAELIPTVVRNFAMATCSMTARIGGIVAPLVVSMAVIDQKLPMLLFGASGIFAGIIGLFLPETLNHQVPERLDEH